MAKKKKKQSKGSKNPTSSSLHMVFLSPTSSPEASISRLVKEEQVIFYRQPCSPNHEPTTPSSNQTHHIKKPISNLIQFFTTTVCKNKPPSEKKRKKKGRARPIIIHHNRIPFRDRPQKVFNKTSFKYLTCCWSVGICI